MRRLISFIVILIVLSLACGLITPASNPNPEPASATETITATLTSTPIPTFTSLPATDVSPIPINPPGADYLLEEERLMGNYAIRFWRNPDDPLGFDALVLIETAGQPSIRILMASALNDLTGSDINGDGYPDVVVETYSGGAHCCFGTQVYSLRPDGAALILQKPESNAGGYFEDLDADGISEFVTYEDSFAYQYCPYAASVSAKVIMAYDPGQDRFVPASPRFPEQYADEIAANEERAFYAPGELGEWDGTNICAILPLALDYLFLGQPDKAQSEFVSRYSGADTAAKWTEILQIVQSSPLYTP
jgi:hypothetical protein